MNFLAITQQSLSDKQGYFVTGIEGDAHLFTDFRYVMNDYIQQLPAGRRMRVTAEGYLYRSPSSGAYSSDQDVIYILNEDAEVLWEYKRGSLVTMDSIDLPF